MNPWTLKTTRSVVLDPHVPTAIPAPRPTDAEWQARFDAGVRRRETEALVADLERLVHFTRQAS